MIYELRHYAIHPGKMSEFSKRFEETPMKLLEKYGAKVIGVWQTRIGPGPEVVYILAFNDLAHREKVLDAMYQDDEFLKYMPNAQVASYNIRILRPLSFSPLK